ncbi:SDR family oxidoreductase [Martelella sp. AD-3]|uniref:SDR family NAD(P)-dependent oxidoreductase n=1 Tax=Martelella sp. AD-3 TaxID=686597 RepID=UPI0009DF5782|nr:SDR family oxidoreductase [Martelella sp. AD-3]
MSKASLSSTPVHRTHEGRIAIVTGAARGFGQAFSLGLAARGATVVGVDLLDLSKTNQKVTELGSTFRGFQIDLTDPEAVLAMAAAVDDEFHQIDILINNAGIADPETWDELNFARFSQVLNVNLNSQFLMAKAVTPIMKRNGYGRILNMSSLTVQMNIDVNIAYRVSKMGVIGLTRALSGSLGNAGITANAISPAYTPTMMIAQSGHEGEGEAVAQMQSIKRPATMEDTVPTVMFLTSEDAHWVTGQSFNVDGGLSFNLP